MGFGTRWLLRRLGICPNAYYNYQKHRKSAYDAQKAKVMEEIKDIYHSHNSVDGYRSIRFYLERRGYSYSAATIHKYMASKGALVLHSDQGSQYTSKAFTESCESAQVSQSMSKAGYPYGNAPMERYFNTYNGKSV